MSTAARAGPGPLTPADLLPSVEADAPWPPEVCAALARARPHRLRALLHALRLRTHFRPPGVGPGAQERGEPLSLPRVLRAASRGRPGGPISPARLVHRLRQRFDHLIRDADPESRRRLLH